MAPVAKGKKPANHSLGAPSQFKQSSRKGKGSWRKNIDLQALEHKLEEQRAEERATGTTIDKLTNNQLFQIDLVGDAKVRRSFPRFDASKLMSSKILSQRSAVPAIFSRSSIDKKPRSSVSREDKIRLLRMAGRKQRGPLKNTYLDTKVHGVEEARFELSHAVESSGCHDIWSAVEKVEVEGDGFTPTPIKALPLKPPKKQDIRSEIALPAVPQPHQGTSYNPPVEDHMDLLRHAHAVAERKEAEETKYDAIKKAIDSARVEVVEGVPLGMTVTQPSEDVDIEEASEDVITKLSARKTKKQRRKAAIVLAEKRASLERKSKRQMLASVYTAKSMRSSLEKRLALKEKLKQERTDALKTRLRTVGLAGKKLGKHNVEEGEVEVQLGDDLSESLRQLKPEGNLFRDRFLNLQQRALIEPHPLTFARKRSRPTTKQVEKFSFKRFE